MRRQKGAHPEHTFILTFPQEGQCAVKKALIQNADKAYLSAHWGQCAVKKALIQNSYDVQYIVQYGSVRRQKGAHPELKCKINHATSRVSAPSKRRSSRTDVV